MNKNFKEKPKNFGREIETVIKYELWSSFRGLCGFCGENLFFIEKDKIYKKDKIYSRNKNITNFSKKHCGEIAHIVSAKSKSIRQSTNEYKNFSKLFISKDNSNKNENNCFNDNDKNLVEGYSSRIISSEKNLILLCRKCHLEVDSKNRLKTNNIIKKIWAKENFEEQVNLMLEEKKNTLKKLKDNSIHQHFPKFIAIYKKDFDHIKEFINMKKLKVVFSALSLSWADEKLWKFINENEYVDFDEEKFKSFKEDIIYFLAKDDKDGENKYKISFIFHDKDTLGNKRLEIDFSKHDQFKIAADSKNKEELLKEVKNKLDDFNNDNTSFIPNSAKPDINLFKEKPDFQILKSLFLKFLKEYSLDEEAKNFQSTSIAYMARWGTGKTTLIRTLAKDLQKFYNYVEINLWNIANSLSLSSNSEDNIFVRQIVKEAITQLVNNPELVSNFIDSSKNMYTTSENQDLKEKMLSSILKFPSSGEKIEMVKERQKFLDQFITSLSDVINTLFEFTKKPTIFVFDDLDRIDDPEKVVAILDAIVAFLDLKNAVYIIPVDESKVMKAISEQKPKHDPYEYINKYFMYSVRPSFIPSIDTFSLFKDIYGVLNEESKNKIDEELQKMVAQLILPTYRAIKDFINNYTFNMFTLNRINRMENNSKITYLESELKKVDIQEWKLEKKQQYMCLLSTSIQMRFPLIIDWFAEDLENVRILALELNKKENIFSEFKKVISEPDILNKTNEEKQDIEINSQNLSNDKNKNETSFSTFMKENKDNLEMLEILLITKIDISSNQFHLAFSIESDKNLIFIKKRFINSVESLLRIWESFKLKEFSLHTNNSFIISLWMTTTLANIKDDNVQNFLKSSEVREIFNKDLKGEEISIKINEFLVQDEGEKNCKENIDKLEKFLTNLNSFLEMNLIKGLEKKIILDKFFYKETYQDKVDFKKIIKGNLLKEILLEYKNEEQKEINILINNLNIKETDFNKAGMPKDFLEMTSKMLFDEIEEINEESDQSVFLNLIKFPLDNDENNETLFLKSIYSFNIVIFLLKNTNFKFEGAVNTKNFEDTLKIIPHIDRLNFEELLKKILEKEEVEPFKEIFKKISYRDKMDKFIKKKDIDFIIDILRNWKELNNKKISEKEFNANKKIITKIFELDKDWKNLDWFLEIYKNTYYSKPKEDSSSTQNIFLRGEFSYFFIEIFKTFKFKEKVLKALNLYKNHPKILLSAKIFVNLSSEKYEPIDQKHFSTILKASDYYNNKVLVDKISLHEGFNKSLAYIGMPFAKKAIIKNIMKYKMSLTESTDLKDVKETLVSFILSGKTFEELTEEEGFKNLEPFIEKMWNQFAQKERNFNFFPFYKERDQKLIVESLQFNIENIQDIKPINFKKYARWMEDEISKIKKVYEVAKSFKSSKDLNALNYTQLKDITQKFSKDIEKRRQMVWDWDSKLDIYNENDSIDYLKLNEMENKTKNQKSHFKKKFDIQMIVYKEQKESGANIKSNIEIFDDSFSKKEIMKKFEYNKILLETNISIIKKHIKEQQRIKQEKADLEAKKLWEREQQRIKQEKADLEAKKLWEREQQRIKQEKAKLEAKRLRNATFMKSYEYGRDVFGYQGSLVEDHIWPLSRSGSDSQENIQLLTEKSNSQKGDDISGTINGIQFKVIKIGSDNGGIIGVMEIWNNGRWVRVKS